MRQSHLLVVILYDTLMDTLTFLLACLQEESRLEEEKDDAEGEKAAEVRHREDRVAKTKQKLEEPADKRKRREKEEAAAVKKNVSTKIICATSNASTVVPVLISGPSHYTYNTGGGGL